MKKIADVCNMLALDTEVIITNAFSGRRLYCGTRDDVPKELEETELLDAHFIIRNNDCPIKIFIEAII